jgi:hypothetical protein
MDITRREFDDVLAQVIAQRHIINGILIALRELRPKVGDGVNR